MITVQYIDASETHLLRQAVLRPNQSLADCKYSSDYEEWQHYLTFGTKELEAP